MALAIFVLLTIAIDVVLLNPILLAMSKTRIILNYNYYQFSKQLKNITILLNDHGAVKSSEDNHNDGDGAVSQRWIHTTGR